jgi:hypothetical protein
MYEITECLVTRPAGLPRRAQIVTRYEGAGVVKTVAGRGRVKGTVPDFHDVAAWVDVWLTSRAPVTAEVLRLGWDISWHAEDHGWALASPARAWTLA